MQICPSDLEIGEHHIVLFGVRVDRPLRIPAADWRSHWNAMCPRLNDMDSQFTRHQMQERHWVAGETPPRIWWEAKVNPWNGLTNDLKKAP